MRPRVRVKPTFPQAAPSVQQRASSHSLIAASTPISTQTASASAASTDAQDAERRASGQSASTSGPGQEQPSISGHAKGRSGRRNGGNAPFAAISLGHGHGRNVAQSDYTPMVHQAAVTAPHADASLPQLHKSPAVSAEHSQHTSPLIAAQLEAKTAQSMAPAVAQPEAVVAQPEAGQPAATLTRNADTSDGHGILMPEVYTSDKPQHHLTDGDSVTTDAKHTDRSSGVVHRQRRSGPSAFPPMPHEAHAYSSTTQPATSESARSAPTAFPQLPHEAHAYSLFAQRDESSFVYKPGPAAFPQPLHEVALQSAAAGQDQALAVSQNAVTGLQAESAQQQPAVELHAAADESEFATQQQTYQKSLLQFAKSHHGGYVQREGHERAPHRRTTRSMLRGADVKTGSPACMASSRAVPYVR